MGAQLRETNISSVYSKMQPGHVPNGTRLAWAGLVSLRMAPAAFPIKPLTMFGKRPIRA
jgi:hypothetical protein